MKCCTRFKKPFRMSSKEGWQQETELGESKAALKKEKRRIKRIWWEKCYLQLSHEDTMNVKDVEIARLKAHLLTITSPAAVSPWTVSSPGVHRVDETNLAPFGVGRPLRSILLVQRDWMNSGTSGYQLSRGLPNGIIGVIQSAYFS